jgi:hypothetical protein
MQDAIEIGVVTGLQLEKYKDDEGTVMYKMIAEAEE